MPIIIRESRAVVLLCALLLRKDWGNSSEEKLCARLYFRKLLHALSLSRERSAFVEEEIMGRSDDDDDDAQRQKRRSLVFKERISSLLSEYFSHHGDVLEFVNSLTESCVSREQQRRRKKKTNAMNTSNNNYSDDAFILEVGEMVVAKAIRLSLDRGMKEREMCARLMERLAFGVCCVKGGPEEEKEETRTRSHFNIVVIICQSNTQAESRGGGVCVV